MRKFKFFVIGILCMLVFIACEQFFKDIEADFEYWTSEVIPKGFSINSSFKQIDGVYYIPSANNVTVMINLHNPRKFNLITPASPGDAGRLINFSGFTGEQPTYVTHYTLTQTLDKQALQLTFKSDFLKDHEWSTDDISPEITFIADNGRKFGKKFRLNLRVNTAPVLEYAGIGKTTDSTGSYYVLLFSIKDMGTMIGSPAESLHKDLNGGKLIVTKNGGTLHDITLSITGSEFSSSGSYILAASTVTQLDAAHPLPSLSAQDWFLRLKTDVKVGGPETKYYCHLKDAQGLSSDVIEASTQRNKLSDVKLLNGTTPIIGTTVGNPKVFVGMNGKTLIAKAAPAGAVITGNIAKRNDDDTWTEISGGTVSGTTTAPVNLPAPVASENEVLYKISLKTHLDNYDDSDEKTFFVKLVRQEVPVLKLIQDFNSLNTALHCISAADKGYVTEDIIPDTENYDNASPLVIYNLEGKAEFEIAPSGSAATVKYKLNGGTEMSSLTPARIQLTNIGQYKLEVWAEKSGIAGPKFTLYIKVENAVTAYDELKNIIQNAPAGNEITIKINNNLTAISDDSEISVSDGKKLTLTHKPGIPIVSINASGWGRIFKISGTGTVLNLADIKLEDGKAAIGGAAYVEDGGILKLTGRTIITPSSGVFLNMPGKNDVYLANGTSIKLDSALTDSNPIVAPITPQTYDETTQVLTGTAVSSEYTKFIVTPQTVGGNTQEWVIDNTGYLKFKQTKTINGGDPNAWKKLKDAVAAAIDGDVIIIKGLVKAEKYNENNGEITVNNNITICGDDSSNDIIDANKSVDNKPKHRIFNVKDGKKLILEKLTLTGGWSQGPGHSESGNGGAIYVDGGILNMTDCKVTDNKAEANGGGIYVKNGTVELKNTIIGGDQYYIGTNQNTLKGNMACKGSGGGIYIIGDSEKTFNMENCTISFNLTEDNSWNSSGGGICIHNANVKVTMNGGVIKKNKVRAGKYNLADGGGVYIFGTKAEFIMKGDNPEISENMVYCSSSGNREQGGGVALRGKGKLIMNSGTIKGNIAKYGKGVYLVFEKDSSNTPLGFMFMSGSAQVDIDNDVYLETGQPGLIDAFISVEGRLTKDHTAKLTMENSEQGYTLGRRVVVGEINNTDIDRFPITKQTNSTMQNWTTELDIIPGSPPQNCLKLKMEP